MNKLVCTYVYSVWKDVTRLSETLPSLDGFSKAWNIELTSSASATKFTLLD